MLIGIVESNNAELCIGRTKLRVSKKLSIYRFWELLQFFLSVKCSNP